MNQGPLILIAV